MKPKIVFCNCNPNTPAGLFQSVQYGKGMRVANPVKPSERAKDKSKGFRCTLCGKIHE